MTSPFFNYAVMFGRRREWVAVSAPRPLRLATGDVVTGDRDPGPEDAGSTLPPREVPLGTAWTGLARLRNGDRDGVRRLLEKWGLWGFHDLLEGLAPKRMSVIYPEQRRPWWLERPPQGSAGAVYLRLQLSGVHHVGNFTQESYDAAVDVIGPSLCALAVAFKVGGEVLLSPGAWAPTANAESADDKSFEALVKRPSGRLLALSGFSAVPPAETTAVFGTAAGLAQAVRGSLEVLARPIGAMHEEAITVPPVWVPRPGAHRRGREGPLWAARVLRQVVRDGHLHPKVYFTNSFLALCWLEFWHAVEHNILYRRCANSDCQRFFMVQRGHYSYCDLCREDRRLPLPRERLIRRAMSLLGCPRDKAKVLVAELHKLDQRYIRFKETGGGWTSGHRHRRKELRKMLSIGTRRRNGTARPR